MAARSQSRSSPNRTLRPTLSSRLAVVALAAAIPAGVAAVVVLNDSGRGSLASHAPPPAALVALGPVQVVRALSISPGPPVARTLPAGGGWVASFDALLAPGSRMTIGLGSGGDSLVIARAAGGADPPDLSLSARGMSYRLGPRRGWRDGAGWRHFEISAAGSASVVSVDGRSLPVIAGAGGSLSFAAAAGHASIRALIISGGGDRAALLLHRVAELHARLAPGSFPFGANPRDALRVRSTWTSGFWAGALWEAAALAPAGGMFSRWALASTLRHLGREHTPTHDVGFMYGESSLAAYQALCGGAPGEASAALCIRLKHSVVAAADELVALAHTNPGAGTIPTNPFSPFGETIVDSMMNIPILAWATRVTGRPLYARLAAHQAAVIGSLLVRSDGSTFQAVHFDRSTGRIVFIGTHQGLSDSSTWSRGEAWALYGFAVMAASLHDTSLLGVAQRLAGYVARHVPASGVPAWDYDAGRGAPVDVSAGVITAAGLLHLAASCSVLRGACSGDPSGWVSLARRMLAGALGYARATPPLGFLGSQVLNGRVRVCCRGGELIFGITYALEALRLSAQAG